MTDTDYAAVKAHLTADEARRHDVYDDATGLRITKGTVVQGHPSWGIGFNLDAEDILDAAIDAQYDAKMHALIQAVNAALPWADALPPGAYEVLLDIAWNAGLDGLLGFHRMLGALAFGDLTTAAQEVVHSALAPARAQRLATLMLT